MKMMMMKIKRMASNSEPLLGAPAAPARVSSPALGLVVAPLRPVSYPDYE